MLRLDTLPPTHTQLGARGFLNEVGKKGRESYTAELFSYIIADTETITDSLNKYA